jgi:hypothetical protein
VIDTFQAVLMSINAGSALCCALGYLHEARQKEGLANALLLARHEASRSAAELVALRRTNASVLEEAGRMATRAKLLAIELQVGDGTKKTRVWPSAKPEVYQP